MRESRPYGSVRGAPSNGYPYRDPWIEAFIGTLRNGMGCCFKQRSSAKAQMSDKDRERLTPATRLSLAARPLTPVTSSDFWRGRL
jgi:hypothetical protein